MFANSLSFNAPVTHQSLSVSLRDATCSFLCLILRTTPTRVCLSVVLGPSMRFWPSLPKSAVAMARLATPFTNVSKKPKALQGLPSLDLWSGRRQYKVSDFFTINFLFSHTLSGMLLLAAWSTNGWLPSGHAMRMALDLGLHRALDKLADDSGKQRTEEEERNLGKRTKFDLPLSP